MQNRYVLYPDWQMPLFRSVLDLDSASRARHASVAKNRIFDRLLEFAARKDTANDAEADAIVDVLAVLPKDTSHKS